MLFTIPGVHSLPGIGRYSLTLLFNGFMLVAVWSLNGSRCFFYIGLSLVLSISTLSGMRVFGLSDPLFELAGLFLMLIFSAISALIAGRRVFILHRADFNALAGAFCVYLLIGFIWAILFRLLQLLGLATFSGAITSEDPFSQLIYFSYVTLVSLGYGDITPFNGLSRVLAYIEALAGQFYLAVLVASLVGAFTVEYRSSR